MKKRAFSSALAVAACAALVATMSFSTGANAATGSDLYVVHALDATGAGPGSSAVTVCVDGSAIANNFTYSQMIGPLTVTTQAHDVKVIAGSNQSCGATPLISQTVTPGIGTYVVAAWFDTNAEGPALAVNQIDDSCIASGQARLGAGHFANAGNVKVLVDGQTSTINDLAAGQLQTNGQSAGDHTVNVEAVADSSEVFDFGTVTLTTPVLSIGFVTGGYFPINVQPPALTPNAVALTPIRGFAQAIPLSQCAIATTTTTSTTTSTTTAPTTTTTAPPAVTPAAAVRATPAFTG